jgi:hypothetical protein
MPLENYRIRRDRWGQRPVAGHGPAPGPRSASRAASTLGGVSRCSLDNPATRGRGGHRYRQGVRTAGLRLPWSAVWGQTDLVTDEVFVGRTDELRRFAALLGGLRAKRRGPRWPRSRRSGEDLAGAAKSHVVLVCGLGGQGKSRLLRRFQEMADGKLPESPLSAGRIRSVWLDWEDAQRDQPSRYASFDGPSLVTVLDAVQSAVIEAARADAGAAKQAGEAFADYRQGAARMPQYAARFADVIAQSRQTGSPVTSEDAASLARTGASIGLAALGHPARRGQGS